MKFHWGRALHISLRWAMYGAGIGLLLGFVVGLGRSNIGTAPAVAIALFWLAGMGKLGWEALTKDYPDA
jgi:uncharacterized membrane protein YczE